MAREYESTQGEDQAVAAIKERHDFYNQITESIEKRIAQLDSRPLRSLEDDSEVRRLVTTNVAFCRKNAGTP